jgi:SAM-dependent methyltransferase
MLQSEVGKRTFAKVARDYDAVRPSYPDELIRDWVALAGIDRSSRVVEFGAGSGQLTKKLAPFGFELHASDISPELVAIAQERIAGFENVAVTCGSFEDFRAEPHSFDACVAATAFHWFDPDIRLKKCAELLKLGGTLAIVQNIHRSEREDSPARHAIDAVYARVIPKDVNESFQSLGDKSMDLADEIGESDEFELVADRSYWHTNELGSDDYLRFLNTSSFQHNLPEDVKRQLFDGIKQAVDAHGGRIASLYEARLIVARRT